MKSLWSKDHKEIASIIKQMIDKEIPVSLRRKTGPSRRTKIFRMYDHQQKTYLVLYRPEDIKNCNEIAAVLSKPDGLPILSFPCPVAYKSSSLLATYLPETVYKIDLRKNPRFEVPAGSLAAFHVRESPKVSMCGITDISGGGAKLAGYPETGLGLSDIIGPLTLSVTEDGGQQIIAEFTVQESIVAWFQRRDDKGKCEFGVEFKLSDEERETVDKTISSLAQDLVDI